MALTITGMGGLAMLGGFVLLGQITGTYEINDIVGMKDLIQSHYLFVPTLLLILLGAFTKVLSSRSILVTQCNGSAHSRVGLFALCHHGKAGIFLLARLAPIFIGAALYHNIVTFVGLFTLCMAACFAILKKI